MKIVLYGENSDELELSKALFSTHPAIFISFPVRIHEILEHMHQPPFHLDAFLY